MAYGSFNAVYEHILQSLLDEQVAGKSKPDRITKDVLWCIGAHCDPYNETWIGIEAISAKTHYAISSVLHALQKCCDRDWLRVLVAYNPIKRRNEHLFQLSPEVRFVRESEDCNLLPETWERYNDKPKWASVTQIFMKESQLDSTKYQTRPKTRPRPRKTQYHHHHHSKPGTPNPDDTAEREGYDANASDDDQRKAQPTPAQSAKTTSAKRNTKTPRFPPPPPLPALELFGAPLSRDDEIRAENLAMDANCPMPHARRLLATFDPTLVKRIVNDLQKERQAGAKLSSFYGLLEYRVQRGIVGADRYGDFIES